MTFPNIFAVTREKRLTPAELQEFHVALENAHHEYARINKMKQKISSYTEAKRMVVERLS